MREKLIERFFGLSLVGSCYTAHQEESGLNMDHSLKDLWDTKGFHVVSHHWNIGRSFV